ncbi:MAG: hypothetical protein PHY83_00110 [Bacilli bacterium]|nr:hypothetical protein [Bacilli bacterium]MDD3098977.1 hypothetical protein [Bacilli bacterium]
MFKPFEHVSRKIITDIDKYVKEEIIDKVKNELSDKYAFDRMLVGSARKNLVVTDKDGMFDLDYHLILSLNSTDYNAKASVIKSDVHHAFQKLWVTIPRIPQ